MDGQRVDLLDLPSKGYSYPKDIEIYVRPLTIKEQIDMERYGISDAEYYNLILTGITIDNCRTVISSGTVCPQDFLLQRLFQVRHQRFFESQITHLVQFIY